jgi:putative endonuclease
MTNHARSLYTGVTNDLERRVRQHREKLNRGFSKKYDINKLVWFEDLYDVEQAILAEKRIKGWTRAKKIALIEHGNPLWLDLSEQFVGSASGPGG